MFLCSLQVVVGDLKYFLWIPAGTKHVKVKTLTQTFCAGISRAAIWMDHCLGNGHARWIVFVEDISPGCVNLVNLIAVKQVIGAVVFHNLQVIGLALWKVTVLQILD
ncbi:unannotated protein [freshwater metagenome]|uniref:Unannotated protein n=1 Tax=freshwater metagenome TaxID=449393 RepID=A0A6J6DCM4_9ZZZZ